MLFLDDNNGNDNEDGENNDEDDDGKLHAEFQLFIYMPSFSNSSLLRDLIRDRCASSINSYIS